MPKCISATLCKTPESIARISAINGDASFISNPKGRADIMCYFGVFADGEIRSVIKLTNSDITHNISPDAWTKVPVMGNNPITNGDGATDFTINAVDDDVTCNFTGVVVVVPSITGVATSAGLQFKMKVFIDAAEQSELAISQTDFENGSNASFPFLILSVTSGEKISVRTMTNTFSGTTTIGAASSCYLTMERL